MNNIFSTDDTRSQLMLDEEMPMLWKMTCGAISGATAQSSMSINSSIMM